MDRLKSMDKDDFLNMIGLETRRSTMNYLVPALAIFGVGVLIGTGIGLMVAPSSGRELRQGIADRVQTTATQARRVAERQAGELTDRLEKAGADRKAEVERKKEDALG